MMEKTAKFQVFFPGGLPVAPDVLGLWNLSASPPDADAMETSPAASEAVVWRAELPEDPDLASQLLQRRGQELGGARLALGLAPALLTYDLENVFGGAHGQQPSYDLDSLPATSSGSVLRRAAVYRVDAVSFESSQDAGDVDGIPGVVAQFTTQVQRLVGQMALVESISSGRKRGITRVDWNGAVSTWFTATGGRVAAEEHQVLLAQSLATRQAWLHFLLMFSACAVRVGTSLATPTFLPLTLWTTWNYLKELVREYRQLSKAAQAARPSG